MHLAIDAVGIKCGGGAKVLRSILAAADADDRINRITVFVSAANLRTFTISEFRKVHESERRREEQAARRVRWLTRSAGIEVEKIDADVFLAATGTCRGHRAIPQITMVQQALPFSREALRLCSPLTRLRMYAIKLLTQRACKDSALVIVQTPTMKDWICEVFGIVEDRVRVVRSADTEVSVCITPLPPKLRPMCVARPDRRILYVGSALPHKNVGLLLSAFRRVRTRLPDAELFVTIPDNGDYRGPGVHCLGNLNYDAVAQAYTRATVFVMPSLVETACLPIVEAQQYGIPVLAADRPYAHDAAGSSAVYFDPLSVEDLEKALVTLLVNSDVRNELVARATRLVTERLTEQPYKMLVDLVVEINERKGRLSDGQYDPSHVGVSGSSKAPVSLGR